jgi:pimeloyl-ACP methyl ester carboxylesterase
MDITDGFVSTDHGRIHYLETGSGPAIILLHTNGNSAYEYEDMLKILAPKFRVIAWDQPGHGDSDPISRHYSVEDFSDALASFMDALGLKTASILGSSIGGAIATDFGARHGDKINTLFICEAPVRTQEVWQKNWWNTEKNYGMATQTMAQIENRLNHTDEDFLTRWNVDRNKAGSWVMTQVMWALRQYDMEGAMPKITCKPVVVVGGKSGVKAAEPIYRKLIDGMSFELMENSGHFPMLDEPHVLSEIVIKYVDAKG